MLFISICISQNYEVTTIEINNNNFSASLPKALLIDNEGFLWYSTYNGIVREMGNLNSFFFEYAKEESLEVIYTSSILQTSKNKIIACTNRGINILDLTTGESKWVKTNYPDTDTRVSFTSAKEDSKGNIWLGTSKNYMYCYTNKEQLIYSKILKSNYPATDVKQYNKAKIKIVEILEDQSLIINQDNKWFQIIDGLSYLMFDASQSFKNNNNISMTLVPNGSLFKENTSGKYTFNGQKYEFKYIKEINRQIVQIPYTKVQFIPNKFSDNFYKTINFISVDYKTLHGFRLENQNGNYNLLEIEKFTFKRPINFVTYDKSGYFWTQTENGVNKIQYTGLGFKKYLNQLSISCRSISEDSEGNISMITHSGFFIKKKNNDFFEEIEVSKKNKDHYQYLRTLAYGFYKADNNNYWLYGFGNSLVNYNLKAKKLNFYYFPIDNITVVDLIKIQNSKFLIATSSGLFEFNTTNKTFKDVSKINNNIDLKNISVTDLYLTKDKTTLWISSLSTHALVKINQITGEITSFNSKSSVLPLVANSVKVIYEDYDQNIWLGTDHGLQKVNPKNYAYKNFTLNTGLINDNIASILEDQDNLWVATFYGLIKLNKKTENFQSYFTKDGLSNNEFNVKSAFKTSNNEFYFGGLNGVNRFNSEKISQISQNKFSLFLTQYELYDKQLKANNAVLTFKDTINTFTIPNQQNYLTLKFAINDVLNSDKNTYQYRIPEISKDWISLGNYSTLQLRGLKPATYNLHVRGFSSNGNLTNTLDYKINVKQIFYKQYWFIGLNVLAILGFITYRNRRRRFYLKKSFDQKIKIKQLEAKAMRAQMNPHFIFNTLNGMQSIMILKGEHEANKYFTTFSRLLRITLDISNSEFIILKDEIEYLQSYLNLENMRLDNNIKIDFNIDETLDIENNSIPCMLFQPIIENALIHGLSPKKDDLKLTVNFNKDGNNLVGEIIDNGVGRIKSQKQKEQSKSEHKSWATHIMNQRISISNTIMDQKIDCKIIDLTNNQNKALGTKVILSIPLQDKSIIKKTE